jgi:hypothetical protein
MVSAASNISVRGWTNLRERDGLPSSTSAEAWTETWFQSQSAEHCPKIPDFIAFLWLNPTAFVFHLSICGRMSEGPYCFSIR